MPNNAAHSFLAHGGPDSLFECRTVRYVRQRFVPHFHPHFAIGTVVAGESTTRYRGKTDVHAPGTITVIPPGEVHAGAPVGWYGWTTRMAYPTPDDLAHVLGEHVPLRELDFPTSAVQDRQLSARMCEAHTELERQPDSRARAHDLLTVFRELFDRHAHLTVRRPPSLRSSEPLLTVLYTIESNLISPLPLSELATDVGLSVFQLTRLFNRALGLPPHAYIETRRVELAREMLRAGRSPGEVACECGFSDQSHFTRRFRAVTGLTPRRFADLHAGTYEGR